VDVTKPYYIHPAREGGFTVVGGAQPFEQSLPSAAFSNAADLIAWLAERHGVSIGKSNEQIVTLKLDASEILGLGDPSQTSDGWIEWTGEDRKPVDESLRVRVKFRDGSESEMQPNYWCWTWRVLEHPRDIVAYRVVDPVSDARRAV
jgi:hypothetical protein